MCCMPSNIDHFITIQAYGLNYKYGFQSYQAEGNILSSFSILKRLDKQIAQIYLIKTKNLIQIKFKAPQ